MAYANHYASRRRDSSGRFASNPRYKCEVEVKQKNVNGEDFTYLTGWRKGRGGFQTIFAHTYNGSRPFERNGKRYTPWICEVVSRDCGQKSTYIGLWEFEGQRLFIPELNWCLTTARTKTGNKGWWSELDRKSMNRKKY